MLTPSFSLTATERVLPKLAFDFTTASLDSRVTFTRATSATNPATYTNSSGVITEATDNQPRFDYDPITLVCKGLLIEESRANLLTRSSDFSVNWSRTNMTVNTTAITAPDGTLTGNLVFAATGTGQVTRNFAATSTEHTFSIFVKKGPNNPVTSTWLLRNTTTATNLAQVTVTWATMTFTSNIGGTANTWVNVGDGWWRVTLSASSGITVGNTLTPYALGVIAQGFDAYIWGSQLEAGAFATSYIPTTTTALTRNADVATMTGTNFSDWYSAGIGGISVNSIPSTISGTRPTIQFDDATANEIIALRGNTSNPELYIVDNGVAQAQIDAGTISANNAYNLTGTWATNSCAAAINGNAAVTDSSATMPTVTQARLGCDGTNYFNGWLRTVRYWPQRITNAETQAFSK